MVTLILGGAKSGKSRFALKSASGREGGKAFLATAIPFDEEMESRISRHKEERPPEWITFEEPIAIASLLSEINGRYPVIVLDCLTLWLSNLLFKGYDIEKEIEALVKVLGEIKGSLWAVTNEVGLGIVPEGPLARTFRDHAGHLNQQVAALADEVYFLVAGIPWKLK